LPPSSWDFYYARLQQRLWQQSTSSQPHNSRPKPANAAALLKQEEAATSAAGALDADSSGSDATAE